MSDFANRLAYRFLALPVLDACRVRGLLPALRARGALDAGQLAELARTDGATLDAVLGLLTELGWLARDEAGRHGLTPAGEKWVDEGAGETRGDEKGEADARRRLAALEVALAEGIEGSPTVSIGG